MGSVVIPASRTQQPTFGVGAGHDPSIAANGAGPAFLWVPGAVELVGGAQVTLAGATYAGRNGANVLACVANGYSPKNATVVGGNKISATGGGGLTFLVVLESFGSAVVGSNLVVLGTFHSALGITPTGYLQFRGFNLNYTSTLAVPAGRSVLIGGYIPGVSAIMACNGATYSFTAGNAQSADYVSTVGGYSGQSSITADISCVAVWNRLLSVDEIKTLSANPWRLFQRQQRRLYFGAAAGGNTASVPSGSLSLAGLAPTVSATANQTATVPAAALTLTGLVPTISATANQTVTIPAASLALTGLAPTVSVTANETVTVPAASLTLSGNAPTVSVTQNQTLTVPSDALSVAGLAPTVSATQNQTVSIPAASLTLTGEIPTVTATQNQLLAVPLGSLALTGNIPAIQVGGTQTLDVPLGTLALIGNAPTVTATDNQTVGVPLGALSLAALAPSIASSANQRIVVPLAALTMTGLLPAITATQNQFVVVPVGTFTMVIYAPVLSGPLVRAPVIPKWLQLWYRADVRKQTLFLRSDVTGKQGFARSDVTENEGVVLTKSDDASVQ